jgi:hypothetical protein
MKIAFCGDSFTAGIGCVNLYEQPYPVRTCKHFNAELTNLARGGASNYAIYLQAIHAIENIRADIVVVSMTSMDRFDWINEGRDAEYITARNINYHDYAPFNFPQPNHDKPLVHPFAKDPEYDPLLLSQNVSTIVEAIEKPDIAAIALKKEPKAKLKKIVSFYAEVLPWHVKVSYDVGMMAAAYTRAKKAGINCIVTGFEKELLATIPSEDLINHNWFAFSHQYPDSIKSMHASEDGHQVFSETLIKRIEQNGYHNTVR